MYIHSVIFVGILFTLNVYFYIQMHTGYLYLIFCGIFFSVYFSKFDQKDEIKQDFKIDPFHFICVMNISKRADYSLSKMYFTEVHIDNFNCLILHVFEEKKNYNSTVRYFIDLRICIVMNF